MILYKFKKGTNYLGLDKVLFYFMKIKNLDKINEYLSSISMPCANMTQDVIFVGYK